MSGHGESIVGTTIITGIDESRDEKLGTKTGKRMVSARLYYPSGYNGEPEVVIKNAAGRMYRNTDILSGKKPLVIYNHGYGSYMEANNKLCCELAEAGYFVVSVGHAYESAYMELADGSGIELDKSVKSKQIDPAVRGTMAALRMKKTNGTPKEMYEVFDLFQKKYCTFLIERLREWAADVHFIVGMLKKDYCDYIDFERGIGAMGHSFGGNLAYYLCMNDKDFVCGANMDGAIFGDYSGQRMERPFLQILNKNNAAVVSKVLLDTKAPVEYELFEGITHMGFTDMKYFHHSKMMMGRMAAEDVGSKMRELHVNFFDRYLASPF